MCNSLIFSNFRKNSEPTPLLFCRYMPIKDFDVTPKFDKWVAYEIFKSFMKLENYYEDRCELQIVCVPEGDSYVPRLAYEVKKGYVGLVKVGSRVYLNTAVEKPDWNQFLYFSQPIGICGFKGSTIIILFRIVVL